jgi:hypothetical protein
LVINRQSTLPFFLLGETVNKPPSFPIVLAQLETWKAEVIDRCVERVRLALAAGHPDRAYRVLADFERSQLESPPLESTGLDPTSCERLRRRGIVSVDDLRQAAGQLDSWSEITPTLRRRIKVILEKLR